MPKKRFLVSTKAPGLEFEVLERRLDAHNVLHVKLIGAHKVPFERAITEETLTKYGYEVVTREVP